MLKPKPDERDGLGRTRLRWLTVWAPVAFLALVMGGVFTLHPHVRPTWVLFLMTLTLAGGGAYLFSRFVFASIQRQEEEIVQRNRELTALNAVGEVLSRSLRIDEALPRALETILEAIGVEAGEIFLREEETGEMVLRPIGGSSPKPFKRDSASSEARGSRVGSPSPARASLRTTSGAMPGSCGRRLWPRAFVASPACRSKPKRRCSAS